MMNKLNVINPRESGTSREKYLQIGESLRHGIKEGKYSERIPSLKELVHMHGVCMITANKAVNSLIDEGILYRQPGKGTFVNNIKKPVKHKLIGVFMCASGHMYENIACAIQGYLHNSGFLSMIIDTSHIDGKQLLKRLEEIVAMKPEAILLQANHCAHGSVCAEYFIKNAEKIKKLIVILDAEYKGELKAVSILPDLWHGGYIATKHLIDLGHKRILHVAFEAALPAELYRRTTNYQRILGYKMAIEEAKLHEEIIYGGSDKEEFNRRITSSFGAADRPTAVFTHQDSTALEVYKLLRKLNLKVPDDVALVGCFNTPWSEMMDPSLTSLSIREDELGRIIAETIAKNTDSAEDIYIKPELIVRKSSGSQLDS